MAAISSQQSKGEEQTKEVKIFPRNNFGSLLPSPGRNSSSLPTWWEFVQYVLATPPRRSFSQTRGASIVQKYLSKAK